MLFAVAAVIVALALLAYLVWLRQDVHKYEIPAPEPPPEERRSEHAMFLHLLDGLNTLDERYRNFTYRSLRAMALIGCGCALALAFEGKLLNDTTDLAAQQQSGRAVAIDALCGAVSGVVDAGRDTIMGGAAQPETAFTRQLEKLGYPPRDVRRAQAKLAAREYGRKIAKAVEDATGREGLARKNGTLDCTRLKSVAGADPPPVR